MAQGGPSRTFADDGRGRRSGRQIVQAAIAYCNWRTGDAWRNLANRNERDNADREWYLGGIRTLTDVLYRDDSARPGKLQLELPALHPTHNPDATERKHAKRTRAELARLLLAIDPALTDARLLSRLPRPKLARMLREREKAAAAARAAERRTA